MNELNTAFFNKNSSSITKINHVHLLEQEKPFIIEKTVTLSKIDYENFITDFYADRWFIYKFGELCKADDEGVWHCICIKQKGNNDGILVMSNGCNFPQWVAYLHNTESFQAIA